MQSVVPSASADLRLSDSSAQGLLLLAVVELHRGNARAVEQMFLGDTLGAGAVERFDQLWEIARIVRTVGRRPLTSFAVRYLAPDRAIGFVEFGYLIRLQLVATRLQAKWYLVQIQKAAKQFIIAEPPVVLEEIEVSNDLPG